VATPAQFSKNIAKRATQVLRGGGQALENGSVAAGKFLAAETPVDTTLARSNWVAKAGGGRDLSVRPFRARAAVVNEIASVAATAGADGQVNISNGGKKVPYLGALDAGSSSQSPGGFLRGGVLAAAAAVANTKLLDD
jgi:hypothetical protein